MPLPLTISLPARLDLNGAISFGNTLSTQTVETVALFDCGALTFVEPFGMLYAAQVIQQFRARTGCQIAPINHDRATSADYAAHMGFFQACGFPIGKKPGQAPGSTRYLPITFQSVAALRTSQTYRADVQRIGDTIASQLLQKASGSLLTAVAYAIREVVRNVVEHSEADQFKYCAQYWPSQNEVEIAIIDAGIGLSASLRRNPFLSALANDRDALKLALHPGSSSKAYQGTPKQEGLQNSGFGLYMLYRLCGLGGSFFLGSASAGLFHDARASGHQYHDLACQGTVLSLRINGERLKNFDNQWDTFVAEGNIEAEKVVGGTLAGGDRLSVMLRGEFASLKRAFVVGDQVRHERYGVGQIQDVLPSPQGEMLRVQFGTRSEKVAAHTVQLLDIT